jgi:cytochrome c-type biogenesis protein
MSTRAAQRPRQSSVGVTLGGVVTVCVVTALVAMAAIVVAPQIAPEVAGCVLMIAGFAVMAPCQLQMAMTISCVLGRLRENEGRAVAPSVLARTVRFSLGYLAFYAPVAVLLGLLARVLGEYAWVAILAGAAASLVLGLAALGRGPSRLLSRCRGPLYLLVSGKASFRKPVKAGWAYGRYCVSCCGPYAYALIVLAGATRSVWLGTALVLAYALMMVLPTLVVALITPETSQRLAERAHRLAPTIEAATGLMLVGLGIVLVPEAISGAV